MNPLCTEGVHRKIFIPVWYPNYRDLSRKSNTFWCWTFLHCGHDGLEKLDLTVRWTVTMTSSKAGHLQYCNKSWYSCNEMLSWSSSGAVPDALWIIRKDILQKMDIWVPMLYICIYPTGESGNHRGEGDFSALHMSFRCGKCIIFVFWSESIGLAQMNNRQRKFAGAFMENVTKFYGTLAR